VASDLKEMLFCNHAVMSGALKQNKISLTQQAALFEPHLQCFLPKIETQYPVCASALVNCHPQ